jgi:hypothetical protein
MGTRSTNALVIMAMHLSSITPAAAKRLGDVAHKHTVQGAVGWVWETNIRPFHARRDVLDLQEEVEILSWALSLPPGGFKLYRYGEDPGSHGSWDDHPLRSTQEIADVISEFNKQQDELARPEVDLSEAFVTMVDISTGHIPKHTADALGQPGDSETPALLNQLSYVSYHEYGWIIAVNAEHAEELREEHPELAHLMLLTIANDGRHLKLDSDGIVIDGLPTFDW